MRLQELAARVREAERGELCLQADEIARGEERQDLRLLVGVDAQLGQELAVERGVAQADHGAVEPGGVERGAQDLDDLGGPVRRGRADQLDSRLEELAGLPALRADGAVGAGVVEEAEGRLGRGVAVGDDARDRQRRVRAHREQRPWASKKRCAAATPVAPPLCRARRRTRRSASPPRRSRSSRRPRRACPGARGARASRRAGCPGAGGIGCVMRCQAPHGCSRTFVDVRELDRLPDPAYAGTRSAATRSIRAPRPRRRSSIDS